MRTHREFLKRDEATNLTSGLSFKVECYLHYQMQTDFGLQKESTKEPMPFSLIGCRFKMRHKTNCRNDNFKKKKINKK